MFPLSFVQPELYTVVSSDPEQTGRAPEPKLSEEVVTILFPAVPELLVCN